MNLFKSKTKMTSIYVGNLPWSMSDEGLKDLFAAHGTAKLFGAPHIAMFDGLQLWSLAGVAGMLEVAGPRSRSDHTDTGLTLTPVRVCCRKCGHEWTIE